MAFSQVSGISFMIETRCTLSVSLASVIQTGQQTLLQTGTVTDAAEHSQRPTRLPARQLLLLDSTGPQAFEDLWQQ